MQQIDVHSILHNHVIRTPSINAKLPTLVSFAIEKQRLISYSFWFKKNSYLVCSSGVYLCELYFKTVISVLKFIKGCL